MYKARAIRILRIASFALALALASGPAATQETSVAANSEVNAEVLTRKIAEVESSSNLDEQLAGTLIELYRRALTNLERARVEQASADTFARMAAEAPVQLADLRETAEALGKTPPVKVPTGASLEELEQSLATQRGRLAEAETRYSGVRERYNNEVARPAQARDRLAAARAEREDAAAELVAPQPPGETSEITEARRWHLQARASRLVAEINKLEQELLTHEVRRDLLEAQREKAALDVDGLKSHVNALEAVIATLRTAEAEQVREQAVAASEELATQHEIVRDLAARNVELGERLAQQNGEIQAASQLRDSIREENNDLIEAPGNTRSKLALAGVNQALGHLLIDQKRAMQETSFLLEEARNGEDLAAQVGVEQIELGEQRRDLRDTEGYLLRLTHELAQEEAAQVIEQLRPLVSIRADLLDKSIDTGGRYLQVLGELDLSRRQLTATLGEYNEFLEKTLMWVRSSQPVSPGVLLNVPAEIGGFIAPGIWAAFFRDLADALIAQPLAAAILLILLVLSIYRPRWLKRIDACAKNVGRLTEDRFADSVRALFHTILAAAPLPLVLVLVGLTVLDSTGAGEFSNAFATALWKAGASLLVIQFFLDSCRGDGLLLKHCSWSRFAVNRLHQELRWFRLVFPAARLVGDTSFLLGEGGALGGLTVVASLVAALSLAVLVYRLFTPAGGILRDFLARNPDGFLARTRYLWLGALASVLPLLAVLWLTGFSYTGEVLSTSYLSSFWLILWILMLSGLLTRWLVLSSQKLEFQAAIERRDATRASDRAAREAGGEAPAVEEAEFEVAEPQIDFTALSSDGKLLLNATLLFVAVTWLWWIWAPIIPALGFLETIALWSRSAVVNGETVRVPVTLWDLVLVVVIGIVTWVGAKGLPSLVELFLLQRTRMSSGARYAITTLLRYTIIGIGAVLIVKLLGVSWSKAQWLVAALGVGIGFGLQEIVANFISGLVILFERPIRVGDVVTVGDTSGVVTRIQIRATTIRDWDRRELLVPNKEFITGRLLNWSLTDDIIRVLIPIGVAYGSDVMLAMKLAEEAAREHPEVLDDPAPFIIFEGFGDNSLQLGLRAYLPSLEHRMSTKSELNAAINSKYEEAGIVIAFPQRDVHLDTRGPLDIRLVKEDT
jgi:potassium efflux system protein